MIQPRDIPDAVLWHEGMLLAPQHFQEAAHRTEALLAYRLAAACPYPWGIARLVIDQAALVGGLLRVEQVEAVLPDGLLLLHAAAGDPPLELDLTAAGQDVRAGPRIVHLAVAARGGSTLAGNGPKRYRSVEGAACVDESTGEGAIEIPRMVPSPVLLAGDELGRPPSRRWASLPLARVAFRDDMFVLDAFCGPRLRVERGTELHAIAGETALRLREKAATLAERLQAPGAELAAGTGWEAVQALARGLPRLEALLASERAHPFELFLALADIVGNLTGIGRRTIPPPLRAYVHDDPLPAYAHAAELIAGAAAQLREPYRTIRFERRGEGRFTLDPPPGAAADELILGVRAGPGAGPAAVSAWLDTAVIGSSSQLRSIRERRTLGAPRRIVDGVAELDLMAPRGVVLARVGPDAGCIRPGEALEVIGRIDEAIEAEPVEVLLFVAAGGSGAGRAP
ncbi:MAG TPA: type VI secretion system baseplate subunit TssK [Geminicoccaceae bacterium]|nr:type VI secretion system baseplate subunit TssK [Geminicoccus sp.]HMU49035.1 type VI secretion system baseplate subunit TssK [Geminicoccaceae bacterium]